MADSAVSPASTDARTYLDMMHMLRQEAGSERVRWEGQWDRNRRREFGDQWDTKAPEGLKQYVINVTQLATIATVAIQTEQRAAIKINPRDTNEPGETFITPQGAMALGELGVALPPDVAATQTPIPAEMAQQLNATFGDLATGNDAIVVNDALVADALTQIVNILWDKSDSDFQLIQNIYNTSINGHQPLLCMWDETHNCYVLRNIHPLNVWIDPISTGIDDAEYVIIYDILSVARAKAEFPMYAEQIEKAGSTGPVTETTASMYGSIGAPFRDTNFQRKMVVMKTMWKRNERIPMTPDEAVGGQHVSIAMEEVTVPVDPNAPMPVPEDELIGTPPPAMQTIQRPIPDTFLTADGRPTKPGDDLWPHRVGIIQVLAVNETELDVRECPYRDIPMAWNLNIPVSYTPYGQGEPERMEDLQRGINRSFSIIMNHLGYYQSPMETMPQSVKNDLQDPERQTYAHPGRIISVSDDLYMQFNGQVTTVVPVPPLPQTYVEFLNNLIDLGKYLGGNVDVLGGEAKSHWSGELVQALQGAARGPISLKSTNTERAVKKVVELILGCVVDFLPEAEWAKMLGKYPPQVIPYIKKRAKEFEYNIEVQIISGKGVVKQVEQEKYLQLFQLGAIDPLTLLEKLEVPNAALIVDKLQQAMMAAAQQKQLEQGGGNAPPDKKGGDKPPPQG